jgi:hypothetical protein
LTNIIIYDAYNFGEEFIRRISHLDTSGKFLYNWLLGSTLKVPNLAQVQQSAYFNIFVEAMTADWATAELARKVGILLLVN